MNANPGYHAIETSRGATFYREFEMLDAAGAVVPIPAGFVPSGQIRTQIPGTDETTVVMDLADRLSISVDRQRIVLELSVDDSIEINPTNVRMRLFYEIELHDTTGPKLVVSKVLIGPFLSSPEGCLV